MATPLDPGPVRRFLPAFVVAAGAVVLAGEPAPEAAGLFSSEPAAAGLRSSDGASRLCPVDSVAFVFGEDKIAGGTGLGRRFGSDAMQGRRGPVNTLYYHPCSCPYARLPPSEFGLILSLSQWELRQTCQPGKDNAVLDKGPYRQGILLKARCGEEGG